MREIKRDPKKTKRTTPQKRGDFFYKYISKGGENMPVETEQSEQSELLTKFREGVSQINNLKNKHLKGEPVQKIDITQAAERSFILFQELRNHGLSEDANGIVAQERKKAEVVFSQERAAERKAISQHIFKQPARS